MVLARAGHVVLDLSPSVYAILTASIPFGLLVLVYLVPLVPVPRVLRSPPSGTYSPSPSSGHERTRLSYAILALAALNLLVWTLALALVAATKSLPAGAIAALAVTVGGWLSSVLRLAWRAPLSADYALFAFGAAHTVLALTRIVPVLVHEQYRSAASFALTAATLVLALAFTLTVALLPVYPPPSPEDSKNKDATQPVAAIPLQEPVRVAPSPERTVNLLEWLSFSWVGPLIKSGSRKTLGYEDVWRLQESMSSAGILSDLSKLGLLYSSSVVRTVAANNARDICLSVSLALLSSALSYAVPYYLNRVLSALSDANADPAMRTSAYLYALLMFCTQLVKAEINLQQLWHERRMIIRSRSQIMSQVYEKALRRRDLSGVASDAPAPTAAKAPAHPPHGAPHGHPPHRHDGSAAAAAPPQKKGGKGGEATATAPKTQTAGSTGKIVQLVSSDANTVSMQLMFLSGLIVAPFELVLAVVFLTRLLGWAPLVGLSVVIFSLPFNHVLMRLRYRVSRQLASLRDRRTDILNEFIGSVRFVKYSATENSWLERILQAREKELAWLLRIRYISMGMQAVWNTTPDLITLVSFTCFTKAMGRELTVPIAFTSLSLFTLARSPMNSLPSRISTIMQTVVSVQRLEAFFNEPEVEPWVTTLADGHSPAPTSELEQHPDRVAIIDGHFRWQSATIDADAAHATLGEQTIDTDTPTTAADDDSFELREVNLEFPRGQLTLLSGATGSGKSSLLLALLGEMERVQGQIVLSKSTRIEAGTGLYYSVAYAAQSPWLQHATIQDNILFGSPFDQERYRAVIKACALERDLELFDAGDQTEIGEKGISLSGGQKARVALARAVYSRAKTVLLDDPLSAVDSHTARHLYSKCLSGPLLKDRTVILITHHVSLCRPRAEYLVHMHNGRIEYAGSPGEATSDVVEEEELEEEQVEEEQADQPTPPEQANGGKDVQPVENGKPKSSGKLVEEESRAQGRVKTAVYRAYLSAGGYHLWLAMIVVNAGSRILRIADRYWFETWGESYRSQQSPATLLASLYRGGEQYVLEQYQTASTTLYTTMTTAPHLPSASDNVDIYIFGYGMICLASLVLTVSGTYLTFTAAFRAARRLFKSALFRVAFAPFRYFDKTPTGRIINRFSSDFMTIDSSLADQVLVCLQQAFSFTVNITVIMVVSPAFILPAILIIAAYVQLSLYYVRCSRDLRRLESNARSPIYSRFGETLVGIVTCRAFGAERRFVKNFQENVDTTMAAHYAGAMANRYLLWRFDFLGALAIAITTFLALTTGASAGLAALAITSAENLVLSIYWLCRFASQLEVDLNAVERVTELLSVPQEPPRVIEGRRPPAIWPSTDGGIVVEDLEVRYDTDLAPVLKGLNFEVKPREKIGLVGRTGSGKSTAATSLLRFVEFSRGKVVIDGVDISQIGLEDLRSRITLISQDTSLYSGTVRSNLDPFDEHTDEECLEVLERVQLSATSGRQSTMPSRVPSPHGSSANLAAQAADDQGSETTRVDPARASVTLSRPVAAGGSNFSAGQRQLLAMARALLRRSSVVIMDEATASVDFETDSKIQHTIRNGFSDCIILTIAHRLRSVIDYDRIMVLEAGEIAEFDTPRALLSKQDGVFKKMCESSADWVDLRAAAGA